MNFVDSLNILGVEAKQIPTIILHGAPSESTEGAVGVLGMDVDSENHDLYKCVAASDGAYTWEPVSTGSPGSSQELTYVIKTLTLQPDLWADLVYHHFFDGMTSNALIHVSVVQDPVMMEEVCRCGVYPAEQGENTVIFKAMYDKPTVAIDMTVAMLNATNLSTTETLIGTGVVE